MATPPPIWSGVSAAPPVLEPMLSEVDLAPLEEEVDDAPVEANPEPAPPAAAPQQESVGKVIAFPTPHALRPPPSSGGYALDAMPLPPLPPPPLPNLQRPPRKAPKHTSQLSFMRLGLLVVVGVFVLLLGRAYVQDTAATVLPPHPAMLAEATSGDVPEPEPVVAPYAMMESELRAQMSLDLLEADSETSFEEALLIELGRVKLDVSSVRVSVGEWAGRKRDVPQSAEFRIKLRFRTGEIDRELAAVGLVVGKYIQRYSLDVGHFEVVMEQPNGELLSHRLNPEASRKFYIQRLDLMAFLEALSLP